MALMALVLGLRLRTAGGLAQYNYLSNLLTSIQTTIQTTIHQVATQS